MRKIQIVIDTNVIIAGLRSNRGPSFQLLKLVGTGPFDINISVPLILEYEAVLLRQLSFLSLAEGDIGDLLDYYCAIGRQHEIFYLWRPMLRDPADEMLLELAVKAQCDFIVTYNVRDFVGSDQFGITILTPKQFLQKIGASLQ